MTTSSPPICARSRWLRPASSSRLAAPGPAKTPFPEGPPGPAKPETKPDNPAATTDFVRKSAQPINLVVVADSDMLDDRFWAQTQNFFGRQVVVPVAGNADFVANAIDVLAGG